MSIQQKCFISVYWPKVLVTSLLNAWRFIMLNAANNRRPRRHHSSLTRAELALASLGALGAHHSSIDGRAGTRLPRRTPLVDREGRAGIPRTRRTPLVTNDGRASIRRTRRTPLIANEGRAGILHTRRTPLVASEGRAGIRRTHGKILGFLKFDYRCAQCKYISYWHTIWIWYILTF